MTERSIGLGFLGIGLAGASMVAAARSHSSFRLSGAADLDKGLRRKFREAERIECYASLEELLAAPGVDAIYVATPHGLHKEHAIQAAKAGKHVIVEKPMALTLTDCDEMIEVAEANGVRLIVGYTHGFDPAVRLIREVVAARRYGALAMISQWNFTDFLYRPRRREELDSARGGGVLMNQIPHQVEIVRTIADRNVLSVAANAHSLVPQRPIEGACSALARLDGGVAATMVYSGYDHFDSDELHGWVSENGADKQPANGSARAALLGLSIEAEERARTTRMGYGGFTRARPFHQPRFGELVVTCANADLRVGADSVLAYTDDGVENLAIPAHDWWPGRGDVLEELAAAVFDGTPPVHDGRFGRETLRVCLAIVESTRLGSDVAIAGMSVGRAHE